jgi:hypothetical protein
MIRLFALAASLGFGCVGDGRSLECPHEMTALNGTCVVDDSDAGGPVNENDASSVEDAEGTADRGSIGPDAASGLDGSIVVDAGEGWSVRVEPLVLHFGVVLLGEVRERSLVVTNDGDVASTIVLTALGGADASAFSSLDLEIGGARLLNPGETISIPLRFGPLRVGRHEAELALDLCNGGCIVTVALIGDGIDQGSPFTCQSELRVVMNAGSCVTGTLSCTNASADPVGVLELHVPPGSAGGIRMMLQPVGVPATIAPGASFQFDIEICSDADGIRVSTHVTVVVDDVAPSREIQIDLDIEALDVRNGCSLEVDDWRVNFGRVPIGETVLRSVRIRNRDAVTGTGLPCEIEPTVQAGIGFSVLSAPFVLQAGESAEVEVTFTPAVSEAAEALLTLHPAYHVDLAAHGTAEPRPIEQTVESRSELFVEGAMGDELPWVGGKDDGYAMVSIPFAFEYLGTAVTEAWISANGFISFEVLPPSTLINSDFPEAPAPNMSVAWWWDDLVIDGATIQWIDGIAPDRVLHIRLLDMVHALGSPHFDVEVRLFEGTNAIELHYRRYPLTFFHDRPTFTGEYSASAGWEGPGGLVGQDLLGCTPVCRDWDWPWNIVYRLTASP